MRATTAEVNQMKPLSEGQYEELAIRLRNDSYRSKIPYTAATKVAYREDVARLEAEFKRDLFATYGVSDNPKREDCYRIAWDHGHSSGYQEVVNYFDDFVVLIKEA